MDLSRIPVGKNPPWQVNVVVEVPMGSDPVKYELDKDSGALYVDRYLHTAMFYPCNYGFVPHTLSDDGDPVDVLVVDRYPLLPGSVVAVRPVGVLIMEDEKGEDEKILAVPTDKLNPHFTGVYNYDDLPKIQIDQIAHFFQHYKDLESEKWVKIKRWEGAETAAEMIEQGIASAEAEELKKAS